MGFFLLLSLLYFDDIAGEKIGFFILNRNVVSTFCVFLMMMTGFFFFCSSKAKTILLSIVISFLSG